MKRVPQLYVCSGAGIGLYGHTDWYVLLDK